jgi:hypothetical protein
LAGAPGLDIPIIMVKFDYHPFQGACKTIREEHHMFEVTDKASEMIKQFLKDREDTVQSIRIMVSGGG